MNFAACAEIQLKPESSTWYRAVKPQFLPAGLETKHTALHPSRFNPGSNELEILYLATNHQVALFEVGALFGSPLTGNLIPNPAGAWTVLNIEVSLRAVTDLTDSNTLSALGTSAQEVTGAWRAHSIGMVQTGAIAPTQELAVRLFKSKRCEAIKSFSAKLTSSPTLAIFPQRLVKGSFIRYQYIDESGRRRIFQLPK